MSVAPRTNDGARPTHEKRDTREDDLSSLKKRSERPSDVVSVSQKNADSSATEPPSKRPKPNPLSSSTSAPLHKDRDARPPNSSTDPHKSPKASPSLSSSSSSSSSSPRPPLKSTSLGSMALPSRADQANSKQSPQQPKKPTVPGTSIKTDRPLSSSSSLSSSTGGSRPSMASPKRPMPSPTPTNSSAMRPGSPLPSPKKPLTSSLNSSSGGPGSPSRPLPKNVSPSSPAPLRSSGPAPTTKPADQGGSTHPFAARLKMLAQQQQEKQQIIERQKKIEQQKQQIQQIQQLQIVEKPRKSSSSSSSELKKQKKPKKSASSENDDEDDDGIVDDEERSKKRKGKKGKKKASVKRKSSGNLEEDEYEAALDEEEEAEARIWDDEDEDEDSEGSFGAESDDNSDRMQSSSSLSSSAGFRRRSNDQNGSMEDDLLPLPQTIEEVWSSDSDTDEDQPLGGFDPSTGEWISHPPPYKQLKYCVYVDNFRKNFENRDIDQEPCNCVREVGHPGCDDTRCINRCMLIECLEENCPCGPDCNNQRFYKRKYKRIQQFLTPNKGWGIKALENIRKGDFVIEYVGEIISAQTTMNRLKEGTRKHYYILTLDVNELIDASEKGNKARFINHSCDPNCETQKWQVRGQSRVGIFAIKDIAKGEEITFDYQFERKGKQKQRCHCGASNCRGFLGEKKKKKKPSSSSSSSSSLAADHSNDPLSPTSPTKSNGSSFFEGSLFSASSSSNNSGATSPLGSPKIYAARRTSSNSVSEPGSPVSGQLSRMPIDSGLRERQISVTNPELPDKMADHYQRLCTILGLTEAVTEEEEEQQAEEEAKKNEAKSSGKTEGSESEKKEEEKVNHDLVLDEDFGEAELISAESWRQQRSFVQARNVFLVRNLVSTVNWLLDQQDLETTDEPSQDQDKDQDQNAGPSSTPTTTPTTTASSSL